MESKNSPSVDLSEYVPVRNVERDIGKEQSAILIIREPFDLREEAGGVSISLIAEVRTRLREQTSVLQSHSSCPEGLVGNKSCHWDCWGCRSWQGWWSWQGWQV